MQSGDDSERASESWQSPGVHEGIQRGVQQDKKETYVSEPVDGITATCGAEIDYVDHDARRSVAEQIHHRNKKDCLDHS